MMPLTVRHSLVSNEYIQGLLQEYEFETVTCCSFLTRGLNDTYKVVADNKKYIFRLYRNGWRTKSDILFEIHAISHLSEFGCLVSVPQPNKDGKWLIEVPAPEGIRYGALFTYSNGDRPEINPKNCTLIGKALGNIHKAADGTHFDTGYNRTYEINLDYLLYQPMLLIAPIIEKFAGEDRLRFLQQITDRIERDLLSENLEIGFCHGDFHNFNMHINNDRIEAFDFDCCGNGYRSYDLAVFWWNLKQNYAHLEPDCWKAFLDGYLSERNLNITELKLLPQFVALRRIWFLGTLLRNDDVWGTNWINKDNLEKFLAQLELDAMDF